MIVCTVTFLARSLTEYEVCLYFGWKVGRRGSRRYVHLAGWDSTPKVPASMHKVSIRHLTEYIALRLD
ncbi:hypothetical protein J7L06_03750 [Candidatus Bathyarchaeota archaeon]|nr:hypothetical protein [Candidatus Bathyarchaeota archaeon]